MRLLVFIFTPLEMLKKFHLRFLETVKIRKASVLFLKYIFLTGLIISWLFSGWPQIFNFPPKVQEVYAKACTSTTLATGTDPSASTIAPGSSIAVRGYFTIKGDANGCSGIDVSALTVTLAGSGTPWVGLAEVRITNSGGGTTYFSAVTSFSSNSVSFSGGTHITQNGNLATYEIRVTPLAHTSMPTPPGASYAIAPYVSAWTVTPTGSGADTNPNTTTIDNTSPSGTTGASATPGAAQVSVGWTPPGDSDFQQVYIYCKTSSMISGEAPTEGTDPTVDGTACDGTARLKYKGASSPQTISSLTNGTLYYFRIYARDTNGNFTAYASTQEVSATPIGLPSVTTEAAGSVAETTATGNGTITNTGGESNDKRGFVYGALSQTLPGNVAPPATYTSYAEDSAGGYGAGAFTKGLTGLTANTTYYIRAYAHNSVGYTYGADPEISFLTLPGSPTIGDFTNIGQTALTANWTAPAGGAGALTYKVYRCEGASCTPSETPIASGVPDLFYADSNLTCNTLYRYRVRATNVTPADGAYSSIAERTTSACGALTVDIVNAIYVSVGSPTMAMNDTTFSLVCQTVTGSFGTTDQQIYINNNNGANDGWTLTLAAENITDVWNSAGTPYDFNDPSGSPTGCANGQMTVDPSVAILAVGQCGGCSVANITKEDPYAFNQGTLDTITLLTATAASDDVGDWTLQGVAISQKIPAEQPAAIDYNINMVLTVAAS